MLLVLILLLFPAVESFTTYQKGALGESVTLTCPSSPSSFNSKNSQVEIEWVLPQMEEIIGSSSTNRNQSNYQLLPSGNLAIHVNFLRAFICASLAAGCFATCCAVHKFRWKEAKGKGGTFSCRRRESTQLQFLPDESNIITEDEKDEEDQGNQSSSSDSSPKLLRESPQGEEEGTTRKSLLDSFPYFDGGGSSEETLREIPLRPIMTRHDGGDATTTPIFYTAVQHHKYFRGNILPIHHNRP